MLSISASAPGKIILFGEHAVVYGRPAIAVPVTQVQVTVQIFANPRGQKGEIRIEAPDIHLNDKLENLSAEHPLSLLFTNLSARLGIVFPALIMRITSSIPVAGGLGSGAAVSIAAIRALTTFSGKSLSESEISNLAFQIEKVYHSNPSGIDNTVIAFQQPIYYVKQEPLIPLNINKPFMLIIANSGVKCSTAEMVNGVKQRWMANKKRFEIIFDQIETICRKARVIIETEDPRDLGVLMNDNHIALQKIGVSTQFLDDLVETALEAGSIGAKLSGAGGGGNIIALTQPDHGKEISRALLKKGAINTIITTVKNRNEFESGK